MLGKTMGERKVAKTGESPIRVLFLASELFPEKLGGVQTVMYQLTRHLSPRVNLALIAIKPESPETTVHYQDRARLHLVPSFGKGPWKYLPRNLAYAASALSMPRVDVVHYHILPGANCFICPAVFRFLKGAKQVISVHDWIPLEMGYYDSREKLEHLLHWWFARKNLGLADRFVVNSTFMRDILQSHGYSMVTVIPDGMTLAEWIDAETMPLPGQVKLAFWGKLFSKKGLDTLIKAFALLSREFPDTHLYLVGSGPEEGQYRKLTQDLGLSCRVHFMGKVDHDILKRLAASSDVCVFPSQYEGFGISILEAMALGKPVVTSNRGGQLDFVVHGKNALLVDPDNPERLAACLAKLAKDAGLRRSLGKEARKTAEKYDWGRIAPLYEELYLDLL